LIYRKGDKEGRERKKKRKKEREGMYRKNE